MNQRTLEPQPAFQNTTPDLFESTSADKFLAAYNRRRTRENKARTALAEYLDPIPFDVLYRNYIKSKRWKRFRAAILRQRGRTCERCGRGAKTLHVHHLSYLRLGQELNDDVIVLCVPCHQKRHMDKKRFWT